MYVNQESKEGEYVGVIICRQKYIYMWGVAYKYNWDDLECTVCRRFHQILSSIENKKIKCGENLKVDVIRSLVTNNK